MEIEFINHASYTMCHNGVCLITDPWLEGSAFNNGWSLISKTQFSYDRFNEITHIWFSHEHPDHFSPPNLKKIPIEYRKKITILFQETKDKKVISFCKELGFEKIIELKPKEFISIAPDFEVSCSHFTEGDSYLCVKTRDKNYLNINDCIIRNEQDCIRILNEIGNIPIHTLFSQFSYANKVGNTNDGELRLKSAKEKLNRLKTQIDVFKPQLVIPFASFVFFSNPENFYMNDGINDIEQAYTFINQYSKCEILYPADKLSNPNSQLAIQKYQADLEICLNDDSKLIQPKKYNWEELLNASNKYISEIKKNYSTLLLNHLAPFVVEITDMELLAKFDINKGLTIANNTNPDLILSSDSLFFCFNFNWGGDTLHVNARYQDGPSKRQGLFHTYFWLTNNLNKGVKLPFKEIISAINKYTKNAWIQRFSRLVLKFI